jgi:hypothetical protein
LSHDTILLLFLSSRILEDKHGDRDWLKKNVLDVFTTNEIDLEWLRKQFVKSTRIHQGFSYNDWKYLIVNEDGQERPKDLLYSIRLLFNEWFYGSGPPIVQSSISECGIFGEEIDNSIKSIADKYMDKYGPEKFVKQILHQLIVNWRESIYWFKRKLRLTDEQWASFLTDENGNDIKNLRRFQLQLALNNSFRVQSRDKTLDNWKCT